MEVLTAAGLVPVSVHQHTSFSDRRREPRKLQSLLPPFQTKFSKPTAFTSSLALLSSVVSGGSGSAGALTYEEALDQKMSSFTSGGGGDFDLGGIIDSLVKFGTENQPIVIGGIALLAVPFVLSQILGQTKSYGVESPRNAYAKLSEDGSAVLLDIRAAKEIREVGSPDLRSLKKKAVVIEYRRDDKPGFLKKLSLKFKQPENTTLFILDKFDGSSELVAELATVNGFKASYAIKDGAEGPRGWIKSGLPWLKPKKALSFDYGELQDSISSVLGLEGADGLPVPLTLAAVTGLGLLAYTEIETVLQVLGSVALLQFATKKLLFAQDRKQTLQQANEFLTTKVAPGELLDEIKLIGKALLPVPLEQKALPSANVEGNPSTDIPEAKVEAAAAPSQVNSVPNTEVKAETIPGLQRPLSPYPYYPDFKPPASPSPSKP